MIKKITLITAIAASALTTTSSYAQHEIRLGIGDGAPIAIAEGLFGTMLDVTINPIFGRRIDNIDYLYSGPNYSFDYRYYINNKYNVGLNIGFQSTEKQITATSILTGQQYITNHKSNFVNISAAGELTYLNRGNLRLYGNLNAGIGMFNTQSDDNNYYSFNNTTIFHFQVNPIGIRYGNNFGVFGEAGFGLSHIVKVGLSYKFQ